MNFLQEALSVDLKHSYDGPRKVLNDLAKQGIISHNTTTSKVPDHYTNSRADHISLIKTTHEPSVLKNNRGNIVASIHKVGDKYHVTSNTETLVTKDHHEVKSHIDKLERSHGDLSHHILNINKDHKIKSADRKFNKDMSHGRDTLTKIARNVGNKHGGDGKFYAMAKENKLKGDDAKSQTYKKYYKESKMKESVNYIDLTRNLLMESLNPTEYVDLDDLMEDYSYYEEVLSEAFANFKTAHPEISKFLMTSASTNYGKNQNIGHDSETEEIIGKAGKNATNHKSFADMMKDNHGHVLVKNKDGIVIGSLAHDTDGNLKSIHIDSNGKINMMHHKNKKEANDAINEMTKHHGDVSLHRIINSDKATETRNARSENKKYEDSLVTGAANAAGKMYDKKDKSISLADKLNKRIDKHMTDLKAHGEKEAQLHNNLKHATLKGDKEELRKAVKDIRNHDYAKHEIHDKFERDINNIKSSHGVSDEQLEKETGINRKHVVKLNIDERKTSILNRDKMKQREAKNPNDKKVISYNKHFRDNENEEIADRGRRFVTSMQR